MPPPNLRRALVPVPALLLCLAFWATPAAADPPAEDWPTPQELAEHPHALVVSDHPLDAESSQAAGAQMQPLGTECSGGLDPCGILYNRSGHYLLVGRNSSSYTSCTDIGYVGVLADGQDSNKDPYGWADTDCFAGMDCSVFYLGWHDPYEWIRFWTSVWVYDATC